MKKKYNREEAEKINEEVFLALDRWVVRQQKKHSGTPYFFDAVFRSLFLIMGNLAESAIAAGVPRSFLVAKHKAKFDNFLEVLEEEKFENEGKPVYEC